MRPGGVVAFVTSRYTMDAKDSTVARYLAQRAELLGGYPFAQQCVQGQCRDRGCIGHHLSPKAGSPAGHCTGVDADRADEDGFSINRYFLDHPEMVLGRQEPESTAHGMDYTVNPLRGWNWPISCTML